MESYQFVYHRWVLQELTHSEIRIRMHVVYLGSISRREGKRDRGGKEANEWLLLSEFPPGQLGLSSAGEFREPVPRVPPSHAP